MSRPKLLDLFCCEGGASMGYHRAGFDVYGVDIFDQFSQKRYPFPSHKGDAITTLKALLITGLHVVVPFWHEATQRSTTLHLSDFAAIAASPPCQHASAGTRAQDRSRYPRLIEPTRELLIQTGLPYVIVTTARCDNPRCGHEFTWRGPTDSPSVWARKNIRGHVCPKWRPGQVSQEGGAA